MIALYNKYLPIIKPLFGRYALYGVALIDTLLLPKVLPTKDYARFEYLRNFIFLFPTFLLGVHSGYVYMKYVKQVDVFNTICRIGFIQTLIFTIVACIWLKSLIIAIPLLLINLYTFWEQKLKVEKCFLTIFSFKPILSVCVVFFALSYNVLNLEPSLLIVYAFSITFVLWFWLVKLTKVSFNVGFYPISKFEVKKYLYVLKKIINSVLVSVLLSLLFFLERYFIDKYYNGYLATYSFGYSLCQILIILISSLAYISNVELGERLNTTTLDKIVRLTKIVLGSYFILLTFFLIGVYGISHFYPEFGSLLSITTLLTLSKGFYYAVGILTPILVFKDFNRHMLLGVIVLFTITIIVNYAIAYMCVSIYLLLSLNNLFLLTYSIYVLYLLLGRVQYHTQRI